MKILVNKAHYPVTVLGHGKRIGIWLQGCSIRCRSCCSLDTWKFDPDRGMDIDSLLEWCRDVSGSCLDGITISGGEPFDQPEGLLALLRSLAGWRAEEARRFDILLYSGYSERRLRRRFGEHLRYLDAVVAGPFLEGASGHKKYCGSDNQRLLNLTSLAEERYGSESPDHWKSGMQMAVDDEGIWMIGIPKPGDLLKFEASCAEKGLTFEMPSWRC
jgi:anaerobic ribonucleoside-triphosphate reductase activating protein